MTRLGIGTILRAHGVRGWLRVRATTDAITTLDHVFVGGRTYAVLQAQAERGDFLLQLEGVTSREQASALRGQPVEAERDLLTPPAAGEVYAADIIGCAVFDVGGARLGEVAQTFPGGGHEVLVVKSDAREFMLPLVWPLVQTVDVAARRIVCDPPPGLINLDEADSDR